MVSKIIDVGAKTDIRMVSQIERSAKTGEEVHIYKSQVYDILENGEIELLMPIEGGKIVLLPLGIRLEFLFYTKGGLYKAVGQVKERYRADNRYMVRIELNTPLGKFQRRQFYRLECIMDMRYYNITKEMADMNTVEAIVESLRDTDFFKNQKKANIVDISGGGVRFVSKEQNESDSYILMILTLDNGKAENQYLIVGHIITSQRVDSTDKTIQRFENRVEFIMKNPKIQEEIIKFIFAEERRTRKK